MKRSYQLRRTIVVIVLVIAVVCVVLANQNAWQPVAPPATGAGSSTGAAISTLNQLAVKGRASKTGYSRLQFGDGWATESGCDTRNRILNRDLTEVKINDKCQVTSGILQDPYTGKPITFTRGAATSADIQIDHVVALGDAWQKGAQQLSGQMREQLANDPLELLAVDGQTNQQKSDGDAATWLPPNKLFRCQYVARQIAVKQKYLLWVTQAEKDAILSVLSSCPAQALPNN
jgi:hypothetical protein